jgi:tetratricopeptide (TPR) repeat protein
VPAFSYIAFMRALCIALSAVLCTCTVFPQTQDVAAKFRLAQGLEQGGEYERAATLYKDLLGSDPDNVVYFDGLQRMYMQLKRYDDAAALIATRLASRSRDIALHAQLGTVYYRAGRENDADEEWRKVIALDPANPNGYRYLASIFVENRLLERAASVYRAARSSLRNQNLFTIELAQLLVASMDYGGATDEYIRWLAQNPSQLTFVESRMAAFTGKEDGRRAAIAVVQRVLLSEKRVDCYELLGWLLLEGKQFDEAFDVYRTVDGITGAGGGQIYAFAERVFKERAFAVAARAYREAIAVPVAAARLPYARYGYACALKEIADASDTTARWQAGDAGRPSGNSADYAAVLELFSSIIREYPNSDLSARSYCQIGAIQYERLFHLDGALVSFEHVESERSATPGLKLDVALTIGDILIARGDTAQAALRLLYVVNAPEATPEQEDLASFRLAELEYFAGRSQAAIDRLSTIASNLKSDETNDALDLQSFLQENAGTPPAVLGRFAHADFLARQRKNSEATALFLAIVDDAPTAPLCDDALMKAARLQTAAGLYTGALATYDRLLTHFKDSSTLLDRAEFRVAEVLQYGLHDSAKAIAAYETLLADHPHSLLTESARDRIRHLRGDNPQ